MSDKRIFWLAGMVVAAVALGMFCTKAPAQGFSKEPPAKAKPAAKHHEPPVVTAPVAEASTACAGRFHLITAFRHRHHRPVEAVAHVAVEVFHRVGYRLTHPLGGRFRGRRGCG